MKKNYGYIRAGRLDDAVEVSGCWQAHQAWRAASIRGSLILFQWKALCECYFLRHSTSL